MRHIKYLFVALLAILMVQGCMVMQQKEPSKSTVEYIADARAVNAGVIHTIGDMVQAGVIKPDEAQKLLNQAVEIDGNMRTALSLINVGRPKEGEDLYTKSYTLLLELRNYVYSKEKSP